MIDEIINKSTILGNNVSIRESIKRFYKFPIFRDILNLTFSLIEEMRLFFKIHDNRISSNDGLCEIKPLTKKTNQYIISLWKDDPYIVIHELCHMVEKEMLLNLNRDFLPIIYEDLRNLSQANILIQKLIKQVILKEIKLYQSLESRSSELFARFFELFAWSQELYPKELNYKIRINDLKKFFSNTYIWFIENINPIIIKKIHKHIQSYSNSISFFDATTLAKTWSSTIDKNQKKFKPKM